MLKRTWLEGASTQKAQQPLGAESVAINEAYIAKRMVKLIQQITASQAKGKPLQRFNQAKTLGYFDAEFEVLPDLPEALAQGLFAQPGCYAARVRFASASTQDDRKKDLRGASIKVRGVVGEKLWGEADQQDFLLNSFPVLFAGTPEDFLSFIEASAHKPCLRRLKRLQYFLDPRDPHGLALQILMMARAHPSSPFDICYWSTTPYRLGADMQVAVKYKLTPDVQHKIARPLCLTPHYLSDQMQKQLSQACVCFDFGIQFQVDADRMPIENAASLWRESESPFYTVAKLKIAAQDFKATSVIEDDKRSSFNPWQSLAAHRPLGGINRVRQRVYQEMAMTRILSQH